MVGSAIEALRVGSTSETNVVGSAIEAQMIDSTTETQVVAVLQRS